MLYDKASAYTYDSDKSAPKLAVIFLESAILLTNHSCIMQAVLPDIMGIRFSLYPMEPSLRMSRVITQK